MAFDDLTTPYAAGGVVLALVLGFLLVQPTELVRWLQKKNYQYEVTFALYMLTPTEKFVFNSVLFLTLAMLTIACVLYLPAHIVTISRRAYYYFAGDATFLAATDAAVVEPASKAALSAATSIYRAAANTAVASRAAAGHG